MKRESGTSFNRKEPVAEEPSRSALQFRTATGNFLHDHKLVGIDAGASGCGGPSGHLASAAMPDLPPVSSTWTVMVGYGPAATGAPLVRHPDPMPRGYSAFEVLFRLLATLPIPILVAKGWGKDERRGVFQTFNWTVLSAALCLQAGTGFITRDVVWLALLALPATLFGAWLGTRTYRVLSDRNFRDVVLGLLFLSGAGLVWSSFGLR
jgi:hypothetical protein